MDAPEPETPFAAVSAQTTRMQQVSTLDKIPPDPKTVDDVRVDYDADALQMYQSYLDKATPYVTYRWVGTGVVFVMFALRIIFAQGWYIGRDTSIACEPKRSKRY